MWKTVIALGIGMGIGTVACGGGGDAGGGEGQQQNEQKQQSTSTTEPTSCIAKTDKGNDKSVGAYCDSSTKCASGMLCTGDFGQQPSFCTVLCKVDGDCGSRATCYHDSRGSACVPSKCLEQK